MFIKRTWGGRGGFWTVPVHFFSLSLLGFRDDYLQYLWRSHFYFSIGGNVTVCLCVQRPLGLLQ